MSRRRSRRTYGETDKPEILRLPAQRGPSHEQVAAATAEFEARGGKIARQKSGTALSTILRQSVHAEESLLARAGRAGRGVPEEWN